MQEVCPPSVRFNATRIAAPALSVALAMSLFLLFCGAAAADDPWPQYTNISPLPGGGIAINADGRPDGLGDFHINIPTAYTPASGFANLSASWGDYSNMTRQPFGNGTGLLGVAFGSSPRVYISAMQVSRDLHESKAFNGQVLVASQMSKMPGLAVGVQDIFMKEDQGRSVYGVATKSLSLGNHTIFGTVGFGGGRFLKRPFGGLSVPLGEHFNFATEWDGFQINNGIGWRPAGRHGAMTILGAFNGRAGWLAGVAFSAQLGPR